MSQVIQSSVNSEAVQALSVRYQEPNWAKELRVEALSIYEQLGLPVKDEGWRNLRLKEVPLDRIITSSTRTEIPKALQDRIAQVGSVIVHYNQDVVEARLAPGLADQGVILTSMSDAIINHADKVQKYFGRLYSAKESKFAALHYALRSGGVFLYVPKNVVIDEPIQFITYVDEADLAVCNHTLIVAEPFSKVSVIDLSMSDLQDDTAIHSGAVEIFTEDTAKVQYVALQNFEDKVYSFNPRRAHVGNNADVQWAVSELGGKIARSENTAFVEGNSGNSDMVLVFFASDAQQLDVSAGMVHRGLHGSSDIVAKGVMTDQSKSIWRGLGHIENGAKGCKTFQRENSLILSEDAKGDAIPALLIEETDVVGAGHAATVGRIDETQLFYLQSRGISLKQAQRMIVEGFFGAVLEKIPVESIRQEVQQVIDKKLGW